MVLDLKLPKMTGFDLLEKVKTSERSHALPVIVYTGKELTRREETKLKRYAETIVVKDARSPERLLDETSLFLHRVESKLPESKRKMLEQLHNTDALFLGKKILIVDDDVRNVFALASALEANGMEVLFAENGREGIEALRGERERRPRPDGRDDARDGRLRDDAGDPEAAGVREAADHRADGEGDAGRPRAVDRRGRLRLHHEARRHRPTPLIDAGVALPARATRGARARADRDRAPPGGDPPPLRLRLPRVRAGVAEAAPAPADGRRRRSRPSPRSRT